MSISELAARLLSKTLQFIEELRYFINVLDFKERKHQRLRINKAQIEGCTSDHTIDVKQIIFFIYFFPSNATGCYYQLGQMSSKIKKKSLLFIQGI